MTQNTIDFISNYYRTESVQASQDMTGFNLSKQQPNYHGSNVPVAGAVIEEDDEENNSDEQDDEVNNVIETQSHVVKSSNRRTENIVMF